MPKGPEKALEEEIIDYSNVSVETFREWVQSNNSKEIEKLTQLTPELVRELAKLEVSELYLNGLTQINAEVARELAKFKVGELLLNGLTEIGLEVARELANAKCDWLQLINVTQIDVETAKELAKFGGNILFFGNINSEAVAELVKFGGESLRFENVEAETIIKLAKFGGKELYITGVTEIGVETARELAKFGGNILYLINLTQLTPEVAKELAKFGGKELYFENLSKVRTSVLEKLYRFMASSVLSETKIIENSVSRFEAVEEQTPEWLPLLEENPNFKDIVAYEGAETNEYLRQNGIEHPECFQNLNAKFNVQPVFDDVLGFFETLPNGLGLSAFKGEFQRKNLKEFENTPDFCEIYKDEIIQIMTDYLIMIIQDEERKLQKMSDKNYEDRVAFLQQKIDDPDLPNKVRRRFRRDLERLLSSQTRENTSAREQNLRIAKELLERFDECHYVKKGQIGYKLGSRSADDLDSGDRCSDCTSAGIGGTNFWTVPTWATDPGVNFLYQYDEEGQLAHKFVFVWEVTKDDRVLLTVDSSEVSNKQKEKAGMYKDVADKKKEDRLMEEAVKFFHQWAEMMGLDPNNIYASTFSNTGTEEYDDYPKEKLSISKLGGLKAPNKILKKFNPETETKARIYLQSYQDGAAEVVDEGNIDQESINEVERVIAEYLQMADKGSADHKRVQEIMELAAEDPEKTGRQMNVFLVMKAAPETKGLLSVDGERIDKYLNGRNYSLAQYFKRMMGRVDVSLGNFVDSRLYHLCPKGPLTVKERDEITLNAMETGNHDDV